MSKMIRKIYNTDTTLVMWLERSEDGNEMRWEEVSASSRDGEVVATVKHLLNGTITIEKMSTMPLSTAIGAEVENRMTMAEIAKIETVKANKDLDKMTKDIEKKDKKKFQGTVGYNKEKQVVEIKDKQLSIEEIGFKSYEKSQPIKNVDNSRCPKNIREEYWKEACRRGIYRYAGHGRKGDPSWKDEDVSYQACLEYLDIIELMDSNCDKTFIQDESFIKCVQLGIDPSGHAHPLASLKYAVVQKGQFDQNENVRNYLKEGLASEKAMDFLVKNAKIK